MSFDVVSYVNCRVAELLEDKKGQTMEVKEILNSAICELEKLKAEAMRTNSSTKE